MIYQILEDLNNTPSRKDKEKILSDLKGSKFEECFKLICRLTYHPDVNFHIKDIEMPDEYLGIEPLTNTLYDLEYSIASRAFTGNMAKEWIKMAMSNLTEENAKVMYRVIQRDLRCGISAKTINKVWKNLIYVHPYMRCSSFSEKNLENISFPCLSQTKMDGLYMDLIVEDDEKDPVYRSRNGSILEFNTDESDEIYKRHAISKGYVLQGEAVAVDEDGNYMSREASNGYLNSDDYDRSRIRFVVWDIIDFEDFNKKKCTVPYSKRYQRLFHLVDTLNFEGLQTIEYVDTIECESVDDIVEHFKDKRLDGEEGTVIKDMNAIWKDGTSKQQIKVKVIFDCDLKVVGHKEGTGKNAGMLGAIEFESSDGKLNVSVGSGYKDSQRKEYWNIIDQWVEEGKICTVRANDLIKSKVEDSTYSLFLPRFVEPRHDKQEADDYDRVKKQLDSCVDILKMIKND